MRFMSFGIVARWKMRLTENTFKILASESNYFLKTINEFLLLTPEEEENLKKIYKQRGIKDVS